MTNEAASASDMLSELDAEFAGYRHRIASMSIDAADASMRLFTAFALVEDVQIIDIEAIEWETFDLERMLDQTDDSVLFEFAAI